MKKKWIIIAAALCVALSACERQGAQESAPLVTVAPTAAVTAAQTIKPTTAPTPAATAEPTAIHTGEPALTPAPTPAPTPRPTGPKVSVQPSVEPTAPAVETLAPEVTPEPTESAALPPEPTESLCGLPLAPTPTPEGSQPPAVSDTPVPSESQDPTALPSQSPKPSEEPTVTPEPSRLTDEEVLMAYRAAEEAYRWFDWDSLPLDFSQTMTLGETEVLGWQHSSELSQPAPLGKGIYYPVADERFPTMDALRGYLKGLFSDEVVDRLLPINGERYVEIDGVLCASDDGPFRGTDENTGEITRTVVWPEEGGDTLCTVHVEVELLWEDENYPEGKRVYDFPYQKVGDKWVFTHFESIM